jgi:2'-5' RNA ligase
MDDLLQSPEEFLVRSAAEDQGVDPDHMARMAKTESGFDQSSISPKGARGVMQLMPGTAEDLGVDPTDAAANIKGGVYYFRTLLDRFGGDYRKATAAYNAGPEKVASGKPLPKETEDYVRKVLPDSDELTVSPEDFLKVSPEDFLKSQPRGTVSSTAIGPTLAPQASGVSGLERLGGLPAAGLPPAPPPGLTAPLGGPGPGLIAPSAAAATAGLSPVSGPIASAPQPGQPQILAEEPQQRKVGPAMVTPVHVPAGTVPSKRSEEPGVDVWTENLINAARTGKVGDTLKAAFASPVDMKALDEQLSDYLIVPYAGPFIKGVIESGVQIATSPGTLALGAGIGAAGKAAAAAASPYIRAGWETANAALNAYFAGNAAVSGYKSGKAALEAVDKGEYQEAAKQLGFTSADALFAFLGARSAVATGMDIKAGIEYGRQVGKIKDALQDELDRRESERRAQERGAAQPKQIAGPAPEAPPTPPAGELPPPAPPKGAAPDLAVQPEEFLKQPVTGETKQAEPPAAPVIKPGFSFENPAGQFTVAKIEGNTVWFDQTTHAGTTIRNSLPLSTFTRMAGKATSVSVPSVSAEPSVSSQPVPGEPQPQKAQPTVSPSETPSSLSEPTTGVQSPAVSAKGGAGEQVPPQKQPQEPAGGLPATTKQSGFLVLREEGMPERRIPVSDAEQASTIFRAWVESNGLGASDMAQDAGSLVTDKGVHIARISYNGRVWDTSGKLLWEPGKSESTAQQSPAARTSPPVQSATEPQPQVAATAEKSGNDKPIEEKKTHDYSSTQVNLPPEYSDAFQKATSKIPDSVLADKGRETEPHVTVLYGLHGEDPAEVQKLLEAEGPITAKVSGSTSIFPASKEHPDYDVVKLAINSPDLTRLNKTISEALPNTNDYPEYQPHVTLAYVKAGEGKKYAGKPVPGLTGQTVTFDTLHFMPKSGEPSEIPLKAQQPTVAQPAPARAEKPAPPGPIPSAPWMNRWDVEESVEKFKNHPVLSRATKFLQDFVEETDAHSDGWPYWKLPAHAAAQLQGMIQHPEYATEANFKKALAPIRAFYTRRGNAAGMKFPDTGEAQKPSAAATPGRQQEPQKPQEKAIEPTKTISSSSNSKDKNASSQISEGASVSSRGTDQTSLPERSTGGVPRGRGEDAEDVKQPQAQDIWKSGELVTYKGKPYEIGYANGGIVKLSDRATHERVHNFVPFTSEDLKRDTTEPEKPTKRPQPGDRVQVNMHTGMGGRPEDFGVLSNISTNGKTALVKLDSGEERQFPIGDVSASSRPAPKAVEPAKQQSYKVAVKAHGENTFSYSGQRFATSEEAQKAGGELRSRWMGMDSFEVQPSEDEPNYKFDDSKYKSVPLEAIEAPTTPPEKIGARGLADAVFHKLKTGESLGNVTELNKLAEQYFKASRTSGEWTPKDAFDAMEAGINRYLIENGKNLMEMTPENGIANLRDLMQRLTSQGVRTEEQDKFQQFSTPPTISYVLSKVANLKPTDVVLEPSAGNGGLVVWPKSIGATVHVNEISERRREMLDAAGFGEATAHDGEIINALLDPAIKPTVILMNPPFSAGGAKSGPARNTNQYGFNHVDSALQRLQPGGRLIAILGGGRADDLNGGATLLGGPSGKWFAELGKRYNVRANIRISGKEYQKYGTAFATRIIVIDKDGPTPSRMAPRPDWSSSTKASVDTLEEAYTLLSDVAQSRPEIREAAPQPRGVRGAGKTQSRTPQAGTGSRPGAGTRGIEPSGTGTSGPSRGGRQDVPGGPRQPGAELEAGKSGERAGGGEPGLRPQESPETTSAGGVEGGAENVPERRPLTRQEILDAAKKKFAESRKSAPSDEQRAPAKTAPARQPSPPKATKGPEALTPTQKAAAEAAQRMRDRMAKRLAQSGEEPVRSSRDVSKQVQQQPPKDIDPDDMIDLSAMGATHIVDGGATTFPKWAELMNAGAKDMIDFAARQASLDPTDVLRQIYDISSSIASDYGVTAEPAPSNVPPDVADQPLDGDAGDLVPLDLERNFIPKSATEDSAAYVEYTPSIKGPAHPGSIVESRTMSTVPVPPITYKPVLPRSVVEKGTLSAVQLEAIALAGQQNQTLLPNGARSMLLIGDGTGVGKGREAAGILWDNFRRGRKRLIWISQNWDLMQDAMRDLEGIGAKEMVRGNERNAKGQYVTTPTSFVKPFNSFKYGDKIKHQGLLFSTYGTARAKDKKGNRRIKQMEEYLRGDDDGEGAYIIIDEAHNLKNAVVGGRGQASQQGVAIRELLQNIPKLRGTALSATAATDVINLGWMDRLGIWGPGTAFPTGFNEFAGAIASGRTAAMEMIANELKAQGKYLARTLSFKGVEFNEAKHELTDEQKAIYRTAASAWREVFKSGNQTINSTTNGGSTQRANFNQALGGAQQRFFNILITALKTPTAIELANKALADGKSVVITMVSTGEAAQTREKNRVAAARLEGEDEEDDIPEYDFGPKQILIDLIRENYPTQQYKDDVDDNGNPIKVPVTTLDDEGREVPVLNPEAVAARDALIAQIDRDLHMPENPLDILINGLGGPKKVAELTGRKERFDNSSGKFVPRGDQNVARKNINISEMRNFQDGKKRVAILTGAANAGISMHSSLDVPNQQQRFHITLQVGWEADKAMQMLGRTHRTNQAHPPQYVLLYSDLAGEKRFISTISRRLGSLGALTKGQKNASTGTDLMDKVNLETAEGRAAASAFYEQLLRNNPVPGTGLTGLQILTDLRVLRGSPPTVPQADRSNVPKLMNRLMALDPDIQNNTYNYFYDIFQATVERAIEAGTLDTGVKTLPGDEFHVKEQRSIATDPKTGAETLYYPVDVKVRTHRISPADLDKRLKEHKKDNPVIVRGTKGDLGLAIDAQPIVHASGSVEAASYFATPGKGKWVKVPNTRLRSYSVQPVEEWAAAELKSAESEMSSAESGLEHRKGEVERSTEYEKGRALRPLREQLDAAQARVLYATEPERKEQARKEADAAQKEFDQAAKAYALPEEHYQARRLKEGQERVEEAKTQLAVNQKIADDPMAWAKQEWATQYEAAPAHITEEHHLIGRAVMRYWNAIRDASQFGNIYTTTDSKTGQRVVGVDIPSDAIGQLLQRIQGGGSTVNARQLIVDVLRNNVAYTLEGGIQVRRGRVARDKVIQLIPPNPEVAKNLQALGAVYERGAAPVYYVPNDAGVAENQHAIVQRILDQYPIQPEEPIRQSRAVEGFYSQLERTIEDKMPTKASAAQVLGILRNPQSGVKPDEMKWSGITEWLAKQTKPVTKEQVLEFVRANNVQVEEVTRGSNPHQLDNLPSTQELDPQIRALSNWPRDAKTAKDPADQAKLDELHRLWDLADESERPTPTKFSQYTLPGGKNYREVLLTLPPRSGEAMREAGRKLRAAEDAEHEATAAGTDVTRRGDLTDATDHARAGFERQRELQKQAIYKSPHWDEPNVLAHVRLDDRTDADGKPVLFVEEVQSDWGQAGRTKGFRTSAPTADEIELKFVPPTVPPGQPPESYPGYWESFDKRDGSLITRHGGRMAEPDVLKEALKYGHYKSEEGVPPMPFAKSWHEFAFRRLLRMAAESGSHAWREATEPESVREQLQHHLGSELATVTPLKVMDAAVLATLKNNQIREAVVKAIPVDVVNILTRAGFSPEQLVGNPKMVGHALATPIRPAVARGLSSALEFVGTRMRTALYRILSSDSPTTGDDELIPAVRARDLNPREIVGMLAPVRIYGLDRDVSLPRSGGAESRTKPSVADSQNTGVGREPSTAELATLLNRHASILSGRSTDVDKIYHPGYERLAWTSGETQAERYDLSKQVRDIQYRKLPNSEFEVWATEKEGGRRIEVGTHPAARLPDVVGKEIAEKIIAGAGDEMVDINGKNPEYVLSGLDLKVGGAGMKGFYDKILPEYANRYAKRWGAKVGETNIQTAGPEKGHYTGPDMTATEFDKWLQQRRARWSDKTPEGWGSWNVSRDATAIDVLKTMRQGEGLQGAMENFGSPDLAQQLGGTLVFKRPAQLDTVHSIAITPSMRESVMEGQPLFAKGGAAPSAAGATPTPSTYRNGILWVSGETMRRITDRLGVSAARGIYVPPARALNLKQDVTGLGLQQAISDALRDQRSLVIVRRDPGESLSKSIATARHELFHQSETWAGPRRGEALLKDSIARKAADNLARVGYDRNDVPIIWSEIGAHLAAGPVGWETMGLSRDEARELFKKYLNLLEPGDLTRLKRIAPQLNEELNAARSAAQAQIDQTEVRPESASEPRAIARSGAGGELQRSVRPALSRDFKPNPFESQARLEKVNDLANALESAGATSETARNLSDDQWEKALALANAVRAQEAKATGVPAKTMAAPSKLTRQRVIQQMEHREGIARPKVVSISSGERGTAPALSDLSDVIQSGLRGGNYSVPGAVESSLIRGLGQTKRASKAVHEAMLRGASPEARSAAIIRAALPLMRKSLEGTGVPVESMFLYYVDSRLQGIRDRWQGFANEAQKLTDEQMEKDFSGGGEDGSMSQDFVSLLDNLQGKAGMPENPAQIATSLVEQKRWEDLRNYLWPLFETAANHVRPAMDPDHFEHIQDLIKTDPKVKEADRIYGERIEKPIAENHALNEGVFTESLGPAGRYFPLLAAEEGKPTFFERLGFKKPQNSRNVMATGLSKKGYVVDTERFRKALERDLAQGGRAAVIQSAYDAGLMKKLPRSGMIDTDTFKYQGIDYPAKKVTVTPPRMVIKPGEKSFYTAAVQAYMPEWFYKEIKDVVDKDSRPSAGRIREMGQFVNTVALQGPADFTFHSANLVGALIGNTPFLSTSLGGMAASSNILTKKIQALTMLAMTDPTEEEAVQAFHEMAEAGALPTKYASATYSKELAKLTGAKLVRFSVYPALYGPKGIDARARYIMWKVAKAINPDVSPKELNEFVNQLGNYTPALWSDVEKALKQSWFAPLAPFYTAGSTMIRNGLNAMYSSGPMITPGGGGKPPWVPRTKAQMRLMHQLMVGTAAVLGVWFVLSKVLTGKLPWQDKRSKLLTIPVGSGNGVIDQFRHSRLGNAAWGTGPEVGYINVYAFSPLWRRGAMAQGIPGAYQTLMEHGSAGQAGEAAVKDVANTWAHPILGPIPRSIFTGITGREAYLTGLRDRAGKTALETMPAIPEKTPPGWPTNWRKGVAAAAELNAFAHSVGDIAGLGGNEKREKEAVRFKVGPVNVNGTALLNNILNMSVVGTGLVGAPTNPFGAERVLQQQRRAVGAR